jgi:DegV family protein with EDD domain
MSFFQKLRDRILPGQAKKPAPETPIRPVKVVTDSTADLPLEIVSELGITIISLQVIFGEQTYRDGIDISSEQFFEMLASSKALPQTSQPSVGEFQEVYERLASDTESILSIHLSAGFSGTFNTAQLAARSLIGRCTIEVIDSGTVSMAMGFAVIAAARTARNGGDLDACAAAARSALKRQRLAVTVDTLEYLRRGGRIGRAAALVGGLLRLKPILTIRDGEAFPLARVRTRKKALEEMLNICLQDATIEEAIIMDSTTPDDARHLREELTARCPGVPIHSGRIGPVIGVHGGPGLIGLAVVVEKPATETTPG